MIWTKNRDQNEDWAVYHKDLTNSNFLRLNLTNSEGYNNAVYEGNPPVAPTSTHWQIGDNDFVNDNNRGYVAMLFASVDGISKVGSYNGSTSNITITTGFQPRFILIKGYDSNSNGRHWIVMDSLRGINPSGNTDYLYLEAISAQNTGGPEPYISGISSTGFTLLAGKGDTSVSTRKYIYYAHA